MKVVVERGRYSVELISIGQSDKELAWQRSTGDRFPSPVNRE
jgi:hypothetical protein